ATEADMLLYFEWANDETVRENSINKSQIIFEDHVKWFTGRLKNSASILLVFENTGKAIGQLRIEIDEKNRESVINYSIDKNYRGKGFGTVILSESHKYYTGLDIPYPLIGFVKLNNTASISAFNKAGFLKLDGEFLINNEAYLKFSSIPVI
ncbi:MAG: GNAT family N-acetyltransferase, partial [Ferruginibacter sp.]